MKIEHALWIFNELIEAKEKRNSYGGDTTKIYTYRFRDDDENRAVCAEDCKKALNEIIEHFENIYPAYQVLIDADDLTNPTEYFDKYFDMHFDRIHVRVEPVMKTPTWKNTFNSDLKHEPNPWTIRVDYIVDICQIARNVHYPFCTWRDGCVYDSSTGKQTTFLVKDLK